jgi:hypothetical protein
MTEDAFDDLEQLKALPSSETGGKRMAETNHVAEKPGTAEGRNLHRTPG